MKIMFLAAANSVHTAKWVNLFANKGHDVYLLSNKNHKDVIGNILNNVKIIYLPFSGGIGYYLNAYMVNKLYKKIKPDIVNTHYASGYGTLARVSRIKNVILSVWGSDVYSFPYTSKLNMKIIRKNINYAKIITSSSKCMAEQVNLLTNKKIDIRVIPFGVDLKIFDYNKFKKEIRDEIIIGNVKSLSKIYGIEYLIKSIKKLIVNLKIKGKEEVADKIRCEIYGDGEELLNLEKLVKVEGLDKVIKFKGVIPNEEVPKVLSRFDIFCATSIKESFGVALVEAAAMKVPIVATDTEGFKEVVINNETGLIVGNRNINEIANALECLLENNELRNKFIENGRKRVEYLYNLEKNVESMEKVFRE